MSNNNPLMDIKDIMNTTYSVSNTYPYINTLIDTGLQTNSSLRLDEANFEGNVKINGDIKIKGKSLTESLEKIEEKLAILHPNEELEEKWDNLRGLRKMYMELEAEIKEKEKVWKILNK